MLKPRMLEGYRVLDFTQYVAGPTCTRILGELGADVVKMEQAPGGDRVRTLGLKRDGQSTYYFQHNHCKRSLALDYKNPRGRELLKALAAKADIVVENYAPGVMGRMGLGYEDIRKVNPKVIMVSVSMAGQTGPLSSKPGYDYMGQAYAGITDLIGEPDRPPAVTTMAIGDISTGVAAAMAACAALLHRERTGEGQYIDASILDTYFHMHELNVPVVSLRQGHYSPRRAGSMHPTACPSGIFKVTGGYIFINCLDHQFVQLCDAMGAPELAKDARFKDNKARLAHLEELKRIIENWFCSFPDVDSAIAAMDKKRVPCAPVLTLEQAMSHPHLRERKTVRRVSDPRLGEFDLPGMPVKFSAWPDRADVKASLLGEDNAAVLRDFLGMNDSEIGELYRDQVLARDSQLT